MTDTTKDKEYSYADRIKLLQERIAELEALRAKHKEIEEKLKASRAELDIRVKVRTSELTKANEELRKEIAERRKAEDKLTKINKCVLGFTTDPLHNINSIVRLCGELLEGDCALYNRLEETGLLCSLGQWQTPDGYKAVDKPDGHICFDVIKEAGDEIMVIRHLQETKYAETDPNVKAYGLKTYIGYPVKSYSGQYIGALCVLYKHDFVPTESDKNAIKAIAVAISTEEARKEAIDRVCASEEQYRLAIDSMPDPIYVVDCNLSIVLFNKAFKELTKQLGLEEDMVGKNLFEAFSFLPKIKEEEYKRVLRTGKPLVTEEQNRIVRRTIITETRKIPIFDKGQVKEIITIIRDITERREAENERERLNKELVKANVRLKQLTLIDYETGLYNYRYLKDAIEAEFDRSRRYAYPLSVIMLDIDYFKSINEVYGLNFGDMVLKQLSQRIRMMVRRYDIVIRFGGEEFVIISPAVDRTQAISLAQRLFNSLTLHSFGTKKQNVKLKLTIAVSSYPEDSVLKAMDLINTGEQLLTEAKEIGGNRVYSSLDSKASTTTFLSSDNTGNIRALRNKLEQLTKKANQNIAEAIFAFAKTIELKDHYTGEHVERTVYYANEIAKEINLPEQERNLIKQAAMLHDLGKIGIRENILNKKTRLTSSEFIEIKKHPQIGADILRPIHFLHGLIPLILYHHERWDGKGYPFGLKKEEIPLGARIIAIADVFQALTSKRSYRKAYSKQEAIKIIKDGAGTQFDPKITSIFLGILKREKRTSGH
ncbi:MAG: diguanylate cyclase [Candidatus Omnitrophica bacterium]|nr:diguanylate cyclase [Candidatus Omnitrophota bacterium]